MRFHIIINGYVRVSFRIRRDIRHIVFYDLKAFYVTKLSAVSTK